MTKKDITGIKVEPQAAQEQGLDASEAVDLKAAPKKGRKGRKQPQGKRTAAAPQTSTRPTGRRKRGKNNS